MLAVAMSFSTVSAHAGFALSSNETGVQIAHQGGKATHRHCHTRVRKGKVVKVCHKHKHKVLHHLG